MRSQYSGITFSLKDSQCLLDPKHELKRLVPVGGVAKNAVWIQMQASVFNMRVSLTC
ncbi:FGGY-family carbohydrate kinase [Ligilactobacillus murinus]|uniref:FGGY-family carbohydrate kinase n=1 Tax=Ligilactobacillus murinus TaxID=1622 RepID=UPI003990AB0A